MRQTTIRSFNLDWEVAHALRFKKKNQSAYVNAILRDHLVEGKFPIALRDAPEILLACFLRDKTTDKKLARQLQDHIDYLHDFTSSSRDEDP